MAKRNEGIRLSGDMSANGIRIVKAKCTPSLPTEVNINSVINVADELMKMSEKCEAECELKPVLAICNARTFAPE